MKKILCVGDWGGESTDYVKNFLMNENFDEYFLLGDNFYPSGVYSIEDPQWEKKFHSFFPNEKKKLVCLGNHDYLGNIFAQFEKTFQKNNGNWICPYFFHDDYDEKYSLHKIFIDSQIFAVEVTSMLLLACNISSKKQFEYFNIVQSLQEKQLKWLENTLQSSNAKWKIVCGHYPLLSNGPHILSKEYEQKIKPLLEKYNVDFYINGHEHNSQLLKENKIHYIVSGGIHSDGSYRIHNLSNPTIFHSIKQGVFSLEIEKGKITIYFHDILSNKKNLCYIKIKV